MKKTMFAISIMTAMISVNAFAISNEDLLNFDNILNNKETTSKEANKETTPKKDIKVLKKEQVVKKETKILKNKTTNTIKEEISKNEDENLIVKKDNKPILIVPVSGQSITLKINLLKDKLVRETIAKTEVVISYINEIDSKYKNEKEIIDFTETLEPFNNFTMYETDKDTLTGIDSYIVQGKLVKKEILTDIKKGFSYFVKIIEKDNRNNRMKLRLDINIIDVNSYEEISVHLADGSYQKIRLPNMKETNSSKEFWINLDSSKQISYKIDDIHKITIDLQRDIPFVQQVFVTDHEKMKDLKKAENDKLIKENKIEEPKQVVKGEEDLFKSLEDRLK